MPASAPAAASGRNLQVGGLVNVRDLGGLPTRDGRRIAAGRLVRSDSLGTLTDDGVKVLTRQLGVRQVVDLRTPEECRREGISPLGLLGVRYRNVPLTPQSALTEDDVAAGKATNLRDDYLAHLDVSGLVLIEGFELLTDEDALPAVVHCTAGKDRTGIFVALLLDLLGVDREAIVTDYAATAPNMATVLDRIRSSPFFRSNGLATAPSWIFAAEPETMDAFLEVVDDRFGGAAAWAAQAGARPSLVADLHAALLEDRPPS